jgi:AbiTii
MKLLDDIIEMASDNKEPIGNLLRKCLVLERQLKNEKFKAWLDLELDGYGSGNEDLPSYRVFNCVNKGDFYGMTVKMTGQPISLHIMSQRDRKIVEKVYLHQPAASYENRPNHDADAILPWNQSLVVKYQTKIYQDGEPALMRAWQEIPGSILVALLEQVRTRVLRFALDLKDSLPPEASTASVVPAAEVDRSVVNIFYGGNNIIATNTAQVSQLVHQTVTQNDLPSLLHAMRELGITKDGEQKLQQAIGHDKPETNAEKAKHWAADIGKYIGKEGVKIGVEVAKQTALRWLGQYLGIPL